VPDVEFDGGSLTNIKMSVPEPALDAVNIKFDNANNGGELTCSQATAHVTSDFKFKYLFITATGQADIKINKLQLDTLLDASTQVGEPAPELAPMLKVGKLDINVNPNDIDITLTGGLVAKVANVLIPLLKSTVIPSVIQTAEQSVSDIINNQVDESLKIYGVQDEIPNLAGLTADYSQLDGPQFTSASVFQMGVNGTFFDASAPKTPTITPVSYDLRDPKGKDAQFFLTDYTIKTGLNAAYDSHGNIDITALLSQYLNVTVTTDQVGEILPELLTKYGSGKAVGISGMWVEAPATADFVAGAMKFTGSLQVTLTVDGETALKASFDKADGQFGLHSDSGKIFGKVTEASSGTVGADFQTTLGITAAQLQSEIQNYVDTTVSALNIELADGVVIPSIMGIDVSDVAIDFFAGYMELGCSLSPQSWIQIVQAMGAWKQSILARRNSAPASFSTLEAILA